MTHVAPTSADGATTARDGLRSSRKPRYQQVAEQLSEEIGRGQFPVGRHLPSEAQLGERFKISRFTTREALRHLEEKGLIARRRGSGSLVRSSEPQVHFHQEVRSVDELLQYDQAGGFQLLHSDRLVTDSTLATWLQTRVGMEYVVLHGIRYQRRSQRPFCISDCYHRASWQGLPHGHERLEDAVRAMIQDNFLDRVGKVEQVMSAVALDAHSAEELKVAPGSAALRCLRRYYDRKGKLQLVAVSMHPSDMYSYVTHYERGDLPADGK
jgi:GntR family transcriptional regulator